jgi:hypothetical protein
VFLIPALKKGIAMPYVIGLAGLFVLWLIIGVASRFKPSTLFIGADGRPSTSKLQMVVWTAAVVFSYLAVSWARYRLGIHGPLPPLPVNLLIAMGVSGATAVSAQAIAVSSAANAPAVPAAPPVATPLGMVYPAAPAAIAQSGIIADDSGGPDIGKIQVVIWTMIAVGVFLFKVVRSINLGSAGGLPDIDTTLVILMGLGHSVYLGKKIVES